MLPQSARLMMRPPSSNSPLRPAAPLGQRPPLQPQQQKPQYSQLLLLQQQQQQRQSSHRENQETRKPYTPLQPPINTYLPRLQQGHTGLLQPLESVIPPGKGRSKRKRINFKEDSTSDEESLDSDEDSEDQESSSEEEYDSDEESVSRRKRGRGRPASRRTKKKLAQALLASSSKGDAQKKETLESKEEDKEEAPVRRALRQTRHDYGRLYAFKRDHNPKRFLMSTMKKNRYISKRPEIASINEVLVPIRIELELEGYKLRDTFTWNLNGIYLIGREFRVDENLNLSNVTK